MGCHSRLHSIGCRRARRECQRRVPSRLGLRLGKSYLPYRNHSSPFCETETWYSLNQRHIACQTVLVTRGGRRTTDSYALGQAVRRGKDES